MDRIDDAKVYEDWYRTIWTFAADHFVDLIRGGWYPELDAALRPTSGTFVGKPDIYHALQTRLVPLLPTTGGMIHGLSTVTLPD